MHPAGPSSIGVWFFRVHGFSLGLACLCSMEMKWCSKALQLLGPGGGRGCSWKIGKWNLYFWRSNASQLYVSCTCCERLVVSDLAKSQRSNALWYSFKKIHIWLNILDALNEARSSHRRKAEIEVSHNCQDSLLHVELSRWLPFSFVGSTNIYKLFRSLSTHKALIDSPAMDELSEYTYRRIDLGKPAIRLIRLLRGVFSVDIIRYELFDAFLDEWLILWPQSPKPIKFPSLHNVLKINADTKL